MADTWPVSGGSVGSRGSTETAAPRSGGDPRTGEAMYAGTGSTVTGNRAADASPGQESLDAFGGEGATVIPGVGIDETPGANSATAMPGSEQQEEQAAEPRVTRAGLIPALESSTLEGRRLVQDASGNEVAITLDSFLQGLQGSLSSILQQGLSGLLSKLPAGIQDLLNSTGITGALSGLVENLSPALSDALGQMAGALGDAASQLAGGLGDAISNIPGVGPVFDNFSQNLGAFTDNLSEAYGNLSPALQAGVDGLVAGAGASLVNKLNIPGLPNIDPVAAGATVAGLRFATNPAVDLGNLGEAAKQLHEKTFGNTGNNIFATIASNAFRSSREMQTAIQPSDDRGGFQFVNSIEQAQSDITKTHVVKDGAVVDTPQTFADTLNSVQRQSFETYQRIAFNRIQDDRIPQLYEELITVGTPATPATRDLYNTLSQKDRDFINNLATRFETFYASQRSGTTLSQDTANRIG